MEPFRLGSFYIDGDEIWCTDAGYGGLYVIKKDGSEIRRCLKSDTIFRDKLFHTSYIVNYNYGKLIVPSESNVSWILYKDGIAKKFSIENLKGGIRDVFIEGNKAYILPMSTREAVQVSDLSEMKVKESYEHWNENLGENIAWESTEHGRSIYVVYRGMFGWFRFDKSNWGTPKFFLLENKSKIACAFFDEKQVWVLPIEGNCIYSSTYCGKITRKIDIKFNAELNGNMPEFSRIIVNKRAIFLLPMSGNMIYIYSFFKKKWIFVDRKDDELNSNISKKDMLSYWWYFVDDDRVIFPPYGCKWLEIDSRDFSCIYKDISIPVNEKELQTEILNILKIDFLSRGIVIENKNCNIYDLIKIL